MSGLQNPVLKAKKVFKKQLFNRQHHFLKCSIVIILILKNYNNCSARNALFSIKCIGFSKLEHKNQKYSQKSVKKEKYYIYISKYKKTSRIDFIMVNWEKLSRGR